MKLKIFLVTVTLFITGGARFGTRQAVRASIHPDGSTLVQTPILKWQNGGCYASWCETGWYSSPAVADLDGDGKPEVIGAAYTLFVLNGEDGSVQWSVDPPGSRVWPGVVARRLERGWRPGNRRRQRRRQCGRLQSPGKSEPGWPKNPASNEFRSLAVGDLDDNGDMEIAVGQALLDKVNVWVLEHTGNIRAGWPQITNTEGSGRRFVQR